MIIFITYVLTFGLGYGLHHVLTSRWRKKNIDFYDSMEEGLKKTVADTKRYKDEAVEYLNRAKQLYAEAQGETK